LGIENRRAEPARKIGLRRNDRARLEPRFEAPIKLPAANSLSSVIWRFAGSVCRYRAERQSNRATPRLRALDSDDSGRTIDRARR
jgi:hypothetical protein